MKPVSTAAEPPKDQMTEILLIRHGETDWNAARRLQGHLDIPLNEEGMRQAAALGAALADEPIDAIYASDLSRAVLTATPLAETRGLRVQTDPRLRERCYGAFEGLLYGEIGARYPEAWLAFRTRDIDARFPQGERPAETLREFSTRSLQAVRCIAARHVGQRIAIVAHGGVLECIYRFANDIGLVVPRDFDIRNASINRLRWDGKVLTILQWSDTSYLDAPVLDETDR
jgi:probable phosphoglycerate mutase